MKIFLAAILVCLASVSSGQTPSPAAHPAPPSGANWDHLKAIPPGTRMHVASDKKGRSCYFLAADDETVTCTRSHAGTGVKFAFPRSEVSSVKLARYKTSTFAGLGIGTGVGLLVGFGIGRAVDPPEPSAFLDFSGIGRAAITVVGGVIGAAGGGTLGATTDFLRGPVVYQRP